jgi:hypothetical protein
MAPFALSARRGQEWATSCNGTQWTTTADSVDGGLNLE